MPAGYKLTDSPDPIREALGWLLENQLWDDAHLQPAYDRLALLESGAKHYEAQPAGVTHDPEDLIVELWHHLEAITGADSYYGQVEALQRATFWLDRYRHHRPSTWDGSPGTTRDLLREP
jgi:hypothetical protein